MPGRFTGKHVTVTGAGSGIGRATALAFAREGAAGVSLVEISQDRLDDVEREVRDLGTDVFTVQADLADVATCRDIIPRILDRTGRLDVLVSNAAAPRVAEPFLEFGLDTWNEDMAVNLTAGFILGQQAAVSMAEQGGGSILYTVSISALGAGDGFASYCASKAALVALIEVMSVELAPHSIRVNGVSPGPADTQRSVDLVGEDTMQELRRSFPVVPMNRLASAEDIANAFLFLASDEAGYVTGHNLVVDGGLTAQAYNPPSS